MKSMRDQSGKLFIAQDGEAVRHLEAVVAHYNKQEIIAYLDEVVFIREFKQKQAESIIELLTVDEGIREAVMSKLSENALLEHKVEALEHQTA